MFCEVLIDAAQGNTQLENALGIIRQISMDDNERETAESIAKTRGEELAEYHAGYDADMEEANKCIIKNMLQNNVPIEKIISYIGLSKEYILST